MFWGADRDAFRAIFQAIEKHAKTEYGYASVYNVDEDESRLKDEMPSYFLAETYVSFFSFFLSVECWVLRR